jgi:hypothetical protein
MSIFYRLNNVTIRCFTKLRNSLEPQNHTEKVGIAPILHRGLGRRLPQKEADATSPLDPVTLIIR